MPKRAARNKSASNSPDYDSDSDSQEAKASRARSQKRIRPSEEPDTDDFEDGPIKVHIIHEKLDAGDIEQLQALVENSERPALELCHRLEDCDVIVTNIRTRARLLRHVPEPLLRQKAIVLPEWLKQTVAQGKPQECGDHAVLKTAPDTAQDGINIQDWTSAALSPTDLAVKDNWQAKYACQRKCTLTCPNQGLVQALSVIGRWKELKGDNIRALAYEHAIAVLKSYPFVITQSHTAEVFRLKGIGNKMAARIQEYVRSGEIVESTKLKESGEYKSLSAFVKIFGIGPATAQMLYANGCRSIEDVERHYGVDPLGPNGDPEPLLAQERMLETPDGKKISAVEYMLKEDADEDENKLKRKARRQSRSDDSTMTIRVALALRSDFDVRIPRAEAEEMQRIVMRELHAIQPGCVSQIVGGYRRGKANCKDVDIVITYPDYTRGAELVRGLCKKLVRRMHKQGLITHVMQLSGFHSYNAMRENHWDTLEKALTVFRFAEDHPTYGAQNGRRIHRRLDLIFAEPNSYWTAIVGWTGSKLFERDLRMYAKAEKQMKFDSSGLTRRFNTSLIVPHSERDVFDILGLPWIHPEDRNADTQ